MSLTSSGPRAQACGPDCLFIGVEAEYHQRRHTGPALWPIIRTQIAAGTLLVNRLLAALDTNLALAGVMKKRAEAEPRTRWLQQRTGL